MRKSSRHVPSSRDYDLPLFLSPAVLCYSLPPIPAFSLSSWRYSAYSRWIPALILIITFTLFSHLDLPLSASRIEDLHYNILFTSFTAMTSFAALFKDLAWRLWWRLFSAF